MQQTFTNLVATLRNQIRIDITCESSASRRFTWNIKTYFPRKCRKISQNLSSAAACMVKKLSFCMAKHQIVYYILDDSEGSNHPSMDAWICWCGSPLSMVALIEEKTIYRCSKGLFLTIMPSCLMSNHQI